MHFLNIEIKTLQHSVNYVTDNTGLLQKVMYRTNRAFGIHEFQPYKYTCFPMDFTSVVFIFDATIL